MVFTDVSTTRRGSMSAGSRTFPDRAIVSVSNRSDRDRVGRKTKTRNGHDSERVTAGGS